MKILVVYGTETGTTEECVDILQKELGKLDVTVCRASEDPDPSEYDLVIAGAPVRFGRLQKETRLYLQAHKTELSEKKKLGLFFLCGLTRETEDYRETLFGKELTKQAEVILSFGGNLKPKRGKKWERILLWWMRGKIAENEMDDGEYTPVMPGILPENVAEMGRWVRQTIERMR